MSTYLLTSPSSPDDYYLIGVGLKLPSDVSDVYLHTNYPDCITNCQDFLGSSAATLLDRLFKYPQIIKIGFNSMHGYELVSVTCVIDQVLAATLHQNIHDAITRQLRISPRYAPKLANASALLEYRQNLLQKAPSLIDSS